MARTLVTGATGLHRLASRPRARRARRRAAAADPARLDARALDGIDFERVDRRRHRPPRGPPRASKGVERVFHVAGMTSLRAADRERVFEVNVGGTRMVAEEALAAGRRAARPHLLGGRARPRASRRAGPTRRSPSRAGRLGIAYVNSKHEAEAEVLRAAAHGLDAVIVNPTFVARAATAERASSMGLVRRFLLRPDPRLRRRRPQHRRRPRRRRGPPARRREGQPRRALHPRRPQLHPAAAVRRPRRGSRASPAPPLRAAAADRRRRRGSPTGSACRSRSASTRSARPRSGGPTRRRRPSASSASPRARTRRRSRTRSLARSSSSATASARPRPAGRGPRGGRPRRRVAGRLLPR